MDYLNLANIYYCSQKHKLKKIVITTTSRHFPQPQQYQKGGHT